MAIELKSVVAVAPTLQRKEYIHHFSCRDYFLNEKKSLCRIEDSSRRTPNKFVRLRSLYVTISSAPARQYNSMQNCFPRDRRFGNREIPNAMEKYYVQFTMSDVSPHAGTRLFSLAFGIPLCSLLYSQNSLRHPHSIAKSTTT